MIKAGGPLVSVVTPVYNGGPYLAECIESVLAQTYLRWEYIIVNNCSTDDTVVIAERYAQRDKRIRLHNNKEFLPIIANHNYALSLICSDSRYCKVVSADDFIFPECLARMVELAEAHPTVGIVGSYQLSGGGGDWNVRCTGLPYWRTVVNGREICRQYLLTGQGVFGAPTCNLYRSDLVRKSDRFFPNQRAEADISACLAHLIDSDFGFVHQVLSFERCHNERITTVSRKYSAYVTSKLHDLVDYGCAFLAFSEVAKRKAELLDEYYRHMAIAAVNFRDRTYWGFQKKQLAELGYALDWVKLGKAVSAKLFDLTASPKETLAKIKGRLRKGPPESGGSGVARRRLM